MRELNEIEQGALRVKAELLQRQLKAEAKAKARVEETKDAIRKIASKGTLPIVEGASEYIDLGKTSMRITRAKDPVPPLLAGKFFDNVGLEIVKQVAPKWLAKAKITGSDFDNGEWQRMITAELVKQGDLIDALGEEPNRANDTIAFQGPKTNGNA